MPELGAMCVCLRVCLSVCISFVLPDSRTGEEEALSAVEQQSDWNAEEGRSIRGYADCAQVLTHMHAHRFCFRVPPPNSLGHVFASLEKYVFPTETMHAAYARLCVK